MHCSVKKLREIVKEIQINYLEFYYHIPLKLSLTAAGGLFRVPIPAGLETEKNIHTTSTC